MKISTLIKKLKEQKAKHGDIRVMIDDKKTRDESNDIDLLHEIVIGSVDTTGSEDSKYRYSVLILECEHYPGKEYFEGIEDGSN